MVEEYQRAGTHLDFITSAVEYFSNLDLDNWRFTRDSNSKLCDHSTFWGSHFFWQITVNPVNSTHNEVAFFFVSSHKTHGSKSLEATSCNCAWTVGGQREEKQRLSQAQQQWSRGHGASGCLIIERQLKAAQRIMCAAALEEYCGSVFWVSWKGRCWFGKKRRNEYKGLYCGISRWKNTFTFDVHPFDLKPNTKAFGCFFWLVNIGKLFHKSSLFPFFFLFFFCQRLCSRSKLWEESVPTCFHSLF